MDVTKGQEVIAIVVRDQLRAENDEKKCRVLPLHWCDVGFSAHDGLLLQSSESKQRLDNLQCDLFAEASSWSPGVKM